MKTRLLTKGFVVAVAITNLSVHSVNVFAATTDTDSARDDNAGDPSQVIREQGDTPRIIQKLDTGGDVNVTNDAIVNTTAKPADTLKKAIKEVLGELDFRAKL